MDRRKLLLSLATGGFGGLIAKTNHADAGSIDEDKMYKSPKIEPIKHSWTEKELITEEQLLVNRWEKTKLLDGLEGEHKKNTAVAMENQRLWCENSEDMPGMCTFRRISIPVICRVFRAMGEKLNSRIFINCPEMIYLPPPYSWSTGSLRKVSILRQQHCLNKEAESTALFAEKVVDALNNYAKFEKMRKPFGKLYLHCIGWVEDFPNPHLKEANVVDGIDYNLTRTAVAFVEFE